MLKTKFFNHKVFLTFFIMIISFLALTACQNGNALSAPTTLSVNEDGLLTWSSTGDVKGYKILIDGVEYNSATPSYDLSKLNLSVGNHTIKVKALTDANGFRDSVTRLRLLML
jgi:hypothetical protein